MKIALAVLALAAALSATPAMAANADQPFQNIDKSNDAGNSTGNAQVDPLNRAQLDGTSVTPGPGTASRTIVEPGPLITLPPGSTAVVPPGTAVTTTPGTPAR